MTIEQIKKIKKGDVLRAPNGSYRIVREVKHCSNKKGNLTFVTFAIQRDSWTTRCYTVLSTGDLKKYTKTNIKPFKLNTEWDKMIEEEIHRKGWAKDAKLHSWHVKGTP